MIPDCTEDGVGTVFTTATTMSLDGDCGCDIPSSCISALFGALMTPLEKLGEMFRLRFLPRRLPNMSPTFPNISPSFSRGVISAPNKAEMQDDGISQPQSPSKDIVVPVVNPVTPASVQS